MDFLKNLSTVEITKYVVYIIFGSGLICEITPIIKANPITSCLRWVGNKLNSDLYKRVDSIEKKITIVEEENDMRRIKDLKSEILSFSRSLKRFISDGIDEDFNEEDYDHIFESYTEYESLLEKYNKSNGKTTRAMETINTCSEKHGYGIQEL